LVNITFLHRLLTSQKYDKTPPRVVWLSRFWFARKARQRLRERGHPARETNAPNCADDFRGQDARAPREKAVRKKSLKNFCKSLRSKWLPGLGLNQRPSD